MQLEEVFGNKQHILFCPTFLLEDNSNEIKLQDSRKFKDFMTAVLKFVSLRNKFICTVVLPNEAQVSNEGNQLLKEFEFQSLNYMQLIRFKNYPLVKEFRLKESKELFKCAYNVLNHSIIDYVIYDSTYLGVCFESLKETCHKFKTVYWKLNSNDLISNELENSADLVL